MSEGASTERAEAVLLYLVRELVENSDAVSVEVDDSGRTVALMAHVAPDDVGRVIGKRGRVAHAIRTLVRAAASRDGLEVDVDFDN